MKRIAAGMGVSTLLAAALLFAWGGVALLDFPRMPSAYEAKEYCSCRFVVGRDPAFCDAFVHQDVVPTQGRTVDEEARTVTVRALGVSSTARWRGPREGCVLE